MAGKILTMVEAHDWIERNYGAHWFLPEHEGGDPEWITAMTKVLMEQGTGAFNSDY